MTLILNGTDNSATTPAVTGTDTDTGVYYPAANQVAIATSGTQAMLANASQGVQFANAIGVGATTPTTSGAGITFPATQSASSNANTLDDYEEGTWTPTDASGAGLSFSSAYGYYIKVGKVVYVQAKIIYPSTASTANNAVGGLPFSMNNSNPYNFPVGSNAANGNTSALRAYGSGSSAIFLNTSDAVSTNAALSSANINFNLTYIADQ